MWRYCKKCKENGVKGLFCYKLFLVCVYHESSLKFLRITCMKLGKKMELFYEQIFSGWVTLAKEDTKVWGSLTTMPIVIIFRVLYKDILRILDKVSETKIMKKENDINTNTYCSNGINTWF